MTKYVVYNAVPDNDAVPRWYCRQFLKMQLRKKIITYQIIDYCLESILPLLFLVCLIWQVKYNSLDIIPLSFHTIFPKEDTLKILTGFPKYLLELSFLLIAITLPTRIFSRQVIFQFKKKSLGIWTPVGVLFQSKLKLLEQIILIP